MKFLLKNHVVIIFLALACIIALFFLPEKATGSSPVPEDAKEIAKMIQKRADEYRAKEEELKPLLAQVAKLEEKMSKLAGGASGFDHSLCTEYGLKYIRGEDGKTGTFTEAGECPLE